MPPEALGEIKRLFPSLRKRHWRIWTANYENREEITDTFAAKNKKTEAEVARTYFTNKYFFPSLLPISKNFL